MAASFLGSFVEVVEAFTIILAVGVTQSWRPAFIGTGLALFVLAVLVLVFGPLLGLVPIDILQFAIGTLLILFGMGNPPPVVKMGKRRWVARCSAR